MAGWPLFFFPDGTDLVSMNSTIFLLSLLFQVPTGVPPDQEAPYSLSPEQEAVVDSARMEIGRGRDWIALRRLREVFPDGPGGEEDLIFLFAGAEAGWGNWGAVRNLLEPPLSQGETVSPEAWLLLGRSYDAMGEWAEAEIPRHLRMRVAVTDPAGRVIDVGRDIDLLRRKIGAEDAAPAKTESPAWMKAREKWERTGITAWDFGDLPEKVAVGVSLTGYPGLAAEGEVGSESARQIEAKGVAAVAKPGAKAKGVDAPGGQSDQSSSPVDEMLEATDLDRLAKMPTRDQAISLLMAVMKAPVEKFVRTVNEVPGKLVRTVAAVRDQKQSA